LPLIHFSGLCIFPRLFAWVYRGTQRRFKTLSHDSAIAHGRGSEALNRNPNLEALNPKPHSPKFKP